MKDFAVAYRQAFIERRLYQFFMIIRVKIIGLIVIAVKEGGVAKIEMFFSIHSQKCFGFDFFSVRFRQIKEGIAPIGRLKKEIRLA